MCTITSRGNLYFDANGNGIKDGGEVFTKFPKNNNTT